MGGFSFLFFFFLEALPSVLCKPNNKKKKIKQPQVEGAPAKLVSVQVQQVQGISSQFRL